jgi:hypothetical protein
MLIKLNFLFDKDSKKVKIKIIEPKKVPNKIKEAFSDFKKHGKKKGLTNSSYRGFLYGSLSEFIQKEKLKKDILVESLISVEDSILLTKMDLLNKNLFLLSKKD